MAVALGARAKVVRVALERRVKFARLRALVVNGDWRCWQACCVVAWWCGMMVWWCDDCELRKGRVACERKINKPFRVSVFKKIRGWVWAGNQTHHSLCIPILISAPLFSLQTPPLYDNLHPYVFVFSFLGLCLCITRYTLTFTSHTPPTYYVHLHILITRTPYVFVFHFLACVYALLVAPSHLFYASHLHTVHTSHM